jgi:hypothetical protein
LDVADLFATYRIRFARLLAKQDREMQALSRERRDAIEREKLRPIAEVDRQLRQSKAVARGHQDEDAPNDRYKQAQEIFEQAMQRRKEVLRERLDACRAVYRDEKRQLIERQEQELEIMSQAIDARLDRMRRAHDFRIEVIDRRHRIDEFRAGVWPPENYSLGNFLTGRDPQRPRIRTDRPTDVERKRTSR